MKWISIKDSLPENGQRIIFFVDVKESTNEHEKLLSLKLNGDQWNRYVNCGTAYIDTDEKGDFLCRVTWDHAGRFSIFNARDDFITHWMALPDPPETLQQKDTPDPKCPGNCKFMVCPHADKCTALCAWAASDM